MRQSYGVCFTMLLIGALIFSCTQNDKITGKWESAVPTNCTDANIIKGGRIEWEFGKKGICLIKYFLQSGGSDQTSSYRNYRVKGDSIYWDLNLPVGKRGLNASVSFVSKDSVILKYRLPSNCIEIYKLKRFNK